jgi:hypothetical protein
MKHKDIITRGDQLLAMTKTKTFKGRSLLKSALGDKKRKQQWLKAIKHDSRMIKKIPDDCRTSEFLIDAINIKPKVFRFLTDEQKTNDVCLAAIMQDHDNINDISSENQTQEMRDVADRRRKLYYLFYQEVQDDRPIEILEIVTRNGAKLEHVPDDMCTPEMCIAAVKQNYNAFRFVPKRFQTREVCLLAVGVYGMNLYYVAPENITLEICTAAIKQNKFARQYVPETCVKLSKCINGVNVFDFEY